MNTHPITRAPSVQTMQYTPSADIENRQGGGLGGAARRQANQLFQENTSAIIKKYCRVIESQNVNGVRPEIRQEFGRFLAANGIRNPGGLTPRQQNICAWVLLENTKSSPVQKLSYSQLKSFTPTAQQLNAAIQISNQLGLVRENYTA